MAARGFWIVNYTASRIAAGAQQHRQMDFNYTVDAPLGNPTTVWDTILIDSGEITGTKASKNLAATPHEIGHVLYNTWHGGELSWLGDATDYMAAHTQCGTGHSMKLAWYEGFADFVSDYTVDGRDWDFGDWRQSPPANPRDATSFAVGAPFAGCGGGDMSLEGNVEAILNAVYLGPVSAAERDRISTLQGPPPSCAPGFSASTRADGSLRCALANVSISCPAGFMEHRDRPSGAILSCDRSTGASSCPPDKPRTRDWHGVADACRRNCRTRRTKGF